MKCPTCLQPIDFKNVKDQNGMWSNHLECRSCGRIECYAAGFMATNPPDNHGLPSKRVIEDLPGIPGWEFIPPSFDE